MEESIKTEVLFEDEVKILEIEFDQNWIITLKFDGKEICHGDWEGNFKEVFERALEIWKGKGENNE